MKKTIFLILSICLSLLLNAQVYKTVNVIAGGLATTLTATQLSTVTNLTVTGTIDARDFKTIRDNMPKLSALDLSTVTVASYTGTGGTSKPGYIYNGISVGGEDYPQNEIPVMAFDEMYYITKISIPSSVTSIGRFAFSSCYALQSFSIPSSVSYIGEYAFYSIPGEITVDANNPNYTVTDGVIFNKMKTALVLCSKSKTGSYSIPSSVTSIEHTAFANCTNLTSILIPSSVTSIGYGAFHFCTGLTSISIPATINNIEGYTFAYCYKLTSVLIPTSITSFGSGAFSYCKGLTSISIPTSVTLIGEDAFNSCTKLTSLSIPSSITTILRGSFRDCTGLTSVSIPSSVIQIRDWAFYNCASLKSISIPSSVTSIWDGAFNNSSVQITLEGDNPNLSVIDGVLFNLGRNQLTFCPISKVGSYNIPSFVNEISQYAFTGCAGLSSIFIPSAVSGIYLGAFYKCTGLTAIYAKRTTPVGMIISSGAFDEVDKTICKLIVPCGSSNNYSTTNYWKDFTTITEDCSLNSTPIANAGIDKSVNEGLTVILDGSLSFDDNKDALTYKWTAPAGITLSSITAKNPSFKAPQVTTNTDYIFSLIVNDGTTDSFADQVVITVKNVNKAPIANAGSDQSVNEGATVSLDGSLSSDPDGNILTYRWTAAGITLSSTTTAKPTFTAPEVSTNTNYIFSLVVTDGTDDSPADQVVITVQNVNKTPVANAGIDQSVNEGTTVTLDGSASSDPDGNPITYKWTAPAGITLSTTTVAKPTFSAPEVCIDADYTFTLVVNDGMTDSPVDTVMITVRNVNLVPIASIIQPDCYVQTGTITVTYPVSEVFYIVKGTNPILPSIVNRTGVFAGLTPGVYDVTILNTAGCISAELSLTINSSPVRNLPVFTQIDLLCQYSVAPVLPVSSTNTPAITGTWNPSQISTAIAGTTTYTFTPDAGQCAIPTTMDITIAELVKPLFAAIGALCQYNEAPVLPVSSTNTPEITGTWNPSQISTATAGITTFTFIPDAGQCAASTTMDIEITTPPIANAGPDQSVNEGTTVSLDGSASSDPDGNPLTYKWAAPEGISLSSATIAKPTFTAPEVTQDTPFAFSLVVNDGTVDSPASTVKVTVLNVIKVGVTYPETLFFKIYPNPTSGILQVEITGGTGRKTEVLVMSLIGAEIFRKEITDAINFRIDLSNQISGVYLLKIRNDNYEYISKIVVSSQK